MLTVVPDEPPDVGGLVVSAPANAFFNELIKVAVDGLDSVDDGGQGALATTILDVTSGRAKEVYRNSGRSSIRTNLRAPKDDRHGDQLLFKVRVMDELGQTAETQVQSVALTQLPNEIRFAGAGDRTVNPALATVGTPLALQVQVLDSAGRPVPAQTVKWIIQVGPGITRATLGTSDTDGTGYAQWNLDTSRAAGQYRLKAAVIGNGYGAIEAVHNVELLTGDIHHLEFNHVPPVDAGEILVIGLRAVDSAGNLIRTANDALVTLSIADPGFHFGFADHVTLDTQEGPGGVGGEQALIRLINGQAQVAVSAAETIGAYEARIAFEPGSSLFARYDDDGNPASQPVTTAAIPIAVLAAPPAGLDFSEQARTNHALGDPARLEVTETATIRLAVVDAYGNIVDTVKDPQGIRQDADFSVDVTLSGSAESEGVGGQLTLQMVQGIVQFPVTDPVPETVELAVTGITPLPADFDAAAGFELNFVKKVPAISQAAFATAHDSLNPPIVFSYTEAVANGGQTAPLAVSLDGQVVPGAIAGAAGQLTFTFDGNVRLGRTYTFDTAGSTWVGAAEGDAVLIQSGSIAGPQAAIPTQAQAYILEGRVKTIELLFGDSVDPGAISAGTALMGDLEAAFTWSSGTFAAPMFSTAGYQDGTAVTLHLAGRYQNEDLRLANTRSMRVLLIGADYDQDGLPNELEIELGLDPTRADTDGNGVMDADEDADADGLSNGKELGLGTAPDNPDSDGDSLADGAEVNTHQSDPLATDSDGDGLADGIEVQTGNDPTDPGGIDIAAWVTGFTVSPASYEIWYSSSEPPAIQLQVTATVTTGELSQTLDVTAERFGTAYSSSDDVVARHEVDGLFRARIAGTAVLTASLGTFADECEFTVKPEIITDPVRLMPLNPEQKLYAGADYGELWLEVSSIVPVEVKHLAIDGETVPIYAVINSMPHPGPVYGEVINGAGGLIAESPLVEGRITASGRGSVFYHHFSVGAPAEYVIEISSAGFEDSVIYLFHDDGELDADDLIEYDYDDGSGYFSKIERVLVPGDYIVAVGDSGLELADAVDGSNDYPDESGDFTLSITTPKTSILRITYPAGVPANALGQVTVGLEMWGQEAKLVVSGAEDPAGANGVYLEDRMFNGYAAYTNESGYWIFWDEGPDGGDGHAEWDLAATLGGEELWYADDLDGEWYDGDGDGAISVSMISEAVTIPVPVEQDPQPIVEVDPGLPATIDLAVGQALDIPMTVFDDGHNHLGVQYVLNGTPLEIQGGGSGAEEGYLIVMDSEDGDVSDGIYQQQGTYNGHPAYTNENGYWIFWNVQGFDEWYLSDELGGSDIDFSESLTENWEMGMIVLPSNFIVSNFENEYGGDYADVNGVYRLADMFEDYPAYTNENGYWIFYSDNGEVMEWVLSDELGGSTMDDGSRYDLADGWDYVNINLNGLAVTDAEDPLAANGVYSYSRMFNGQPAFVDEDGYWIFWDHGYDSASGHAGGNELEEWDLMEVLPLGVEDYAAAYGHEEWFYATDLDDPTDDWDYYDGDGDLVVNACVVGAVASDNGLFDASHIVRFQLRTSVDLTRRYHETRRAYVVTEDNIGTHTLEVRAQEWTAEGLRESVAATYTLNVTDTGLCDPAAVSTVYPAAGETVYIRTTGDEIGGETSNFRPITIRADAPAGIATVQWSNAPTLPGSDEPVAHFIQSRDNVYFMLQNPAAYAALLQAGLTQLDFAVTTNCGNVSTHTVPVTLQADLRAQVALVNPPAELRWTQGESRLLEIALADPGHDVLSIGGYLFPRGWQPPPHENLDINDDTAVTAISTDGILLSHYLLADMQKSPGEDPADWRLWLNAVDDFVFRLPVPDLLSIPTGSYDLRLLTIETDGKIALSGPVPTTVAGNTTPPELRAATVDFKIPAGESIPVRFEARKIGALTRVTLSASGPVPGGFFEDERDAAGNRALSGQFMVPVADTAQRGDIVNILVTAEDALGITATFEIPFEVGAWGAETVVVDSPTTAAAGMRYSNVVVKSGGIFDYYDSAIKLNALVVEAGGEVVIGSSVDELRLHTQLQVAAGGLMRPAIVGSSYHNLSHGGSHGGDASTNLDPWATIAYGDFRNPRFPGAWGGFNFSQSGGGALKIRAPSVVVDGVIAADGRDLTAGHHSLTGSGAGGSILINTGTISGSGAIRANGGNVANDNQTTGAGGRIAIYYDTYGDGIIHIADGLDLRARAGSAPVGENCGGVGTIFLKSTDQQYGELHLDAAGLGHAQGKTTLRAIGRHPIKGIAPVEGGSDHYRVEIDHAAWPIPSPDQWILGMPGLFVSLDADDLPAPLYEVIDNGDNYLVVRSETDPGAAAGRDLIGVIRLDKLVASAGVRLVAADRIHADRFDVAESATLDEVPHIYTEESTNLGELSLAGEDLFYVQNIHLDSLAITDGSLASRGQITVAGNVSVSGQKSRLSARALNISGSLSVDNAVLETAVTHGIAIQENATLTNNATLTVPEADENKYYRLDLAVNQTMRIENAAVDVSGKGYPRGRTWDNGSYPNDPTGGSHGGGRRQRQFHRALGRLWRLPACGSSR